MSKLDKQTVHELTRLCRINCTEEEQETLLKDLKKILVHFEQLQEVDTNDVPACHHVIESDENVFREDVIENILDRDTFLANAPHTGGMIRVPRVR